MYLFKCSFCLVASTEVCLGILRKMRSGLLILDFGCCLDCP